MRWSETKAWWDKPGSETGGNAESQLVHPKGGDGAPHSCVHKVLWQIAELASPPSIIPPSVWTVWKLKYCICQLVFLEAWKVEWSHSHLPVAQNADEEAPNRGRSCSASCLSGALTGCQQQSPELRIPARVMWPAMASSPSALPGTQEAPNELSKYLSNTIYIPWTDVGLWDSSVIKRPRILPVDFTFYHVCWNKQ